jgi:hypothetical protein
MADDRSQDDGAAADAGRDGAATGDAPRRGRAPPTIELEAARVPPRDPPPSDPATPPGASDSAAPPAARPRASAGLAVSALAGAGAALLLGGVVWMAGGFRGPPPLDTPTIATLETLAARVTRLEELPAAAAKRVATLESRLDAIDKTVIGLHDELAAVRARAEAAGKTADEVAAMPRGAGPSNAGAGDAGSRDSAPGGGAGAPDAAAVNDRIATLDATLQALSAEAARLRDDQDRLREQLTARLDGLDRTKASAAKAMPADDLRLRRVIAASSLDLAVRQSEPFAAALAAASRLSRQLGDNADSLAPLQAFAASGVPGTSQLSRDLLAQLTQFDDKSDTAPVSGGLFDRLKAGAARLVKIRRADAVGGDDSSAGLARLVAAARGNDLVAAKREAMALPQGERARLQPWLDRLAAREAALAASASYAAAAMAALPNSTP